MVGGAAFCVSIGICARFSTIVAANAIGLINARSDMILTPVSVFALQVLARGKSSGDIMSVNSGNVSGTLTPCLVLAQNGYAKLWR